MKAKSIDEDENVLVSKKPALTDYFGAKRPVQITLSALLSSRTCVILRSLLAASLALLGRYFFYNKIGFTNLTLVNLGWPTDQLVQ